MLKSEADKALFKQLYQKYSEKLYAVALQIVKNEAAAEDAVHKAFINLADNFARYKGMSDEQLERACKVAVRNAARRQ